MEAVSPLSILVWSVLAPLVLALWLVGPASPLTLAGTVLFVALAFPWAVARTVAIPLGWVRVAWALGWLAEVAWRRDRLGGAALAAAWAVARRGARPVSSVWAERRVEMLAPLRGAGIVAAGLLASARGDDEGARGLLESVAQLPESMRPRLASSLACEWLAGDALARGAWDEARGWARKEALPTRTARLVAGVADRMLGVPVPAWRLRLSWLLAPRRRALRPLVERALAYRAPAPVDLEQVPVASTDVAVGTAPHPYREAVSDERLRKALAAHLAISRGRVGAGGLAGLVVLWDEVLSDEQTHRFVAERARTVGARASEALATLAASVEEDVAALVLATDAGLELGTGPVAAGVARRLRERLLRDVEHAARVLSARVAAGRVLPAIHEWRETLQLRERLARGGRLGGLAVRRLVFEDVHDALCPLACRLWNERNQRPIADALFRFLLAEAEAVGHTRLADHERKNVR